MKRFLLTLLIGAAIAASDLTRHYAIGFGAGILFGAIFFLLGAANGGMRPVGLAAPHLMPKDMPKRSTDPNAGIGCALAAAGIASSVVSNLHYPFSFRIFYAFCIVAGVLIAAGLAWRARNLPPSSSPPAG